MRKFIYTHLFLLFALLIPLLSNAQTSNLEVYLILPNLPRLESSAHEIRNWAYTQDLREIILQIDHANDIQVNSVNIENMIIDNVYNLEDPRNSYHNDGSNPNFKPSCPQLNYSFGNTDVFKCTPFSPVATDYTLQVKIVYSNKSYTYLEKFAAFKIHIDDTKKRKRTIQSSPDKPANAIAGGCGLFGTLRQRMFDCSMLITDHMGTAHYFQSSDSNNRNAFQFDQNKTYNHYPQNYWFLVSCPEGDNRKPYECTWLSPEIKDQGVVLPNEKPFLSFQKNNSLMTATNEYLSFPPDSSNQDSLKNANNEKWKMSDYKNKRILWSGILTQPLKFWDANPYTAYEYRSVTESPIKENIDNLLQPYLFLKLHKTSKPYSDVCQTKAQGGEEKENLLPGYEWRMPSYPQIMTLTGYPKCNAGQYIANGWSPDNPNGGSLKRLSHEGSLAKCLETDNLYGPTFGMSASIVPGFYTEDDKNKKRYLWSSATMTYRKTTLVGGMWNEHAWGFDSKEGLVNDWDRDDVHGIRCASMEWDY